MNRFYYTIFYSILPIFNGNIFHWPDTVSGLNKIIFGVLTITTILLICIINIVGYFSVLYIIKHTDLEKKYPKFKPIIKYYENTSIIFLIIEIIFVISILLLIIGLCAQLIYTSHDL